MEFKLTSNYGPTGDQPQAIDQLVRSIESGKRYSTLLGVTGSGKTFTMANVIAKVDRPTLVLCHNKTLAAQLYSEFKNFFPENAVEYYVSYYDYYQPEAYLPTTGTYIEKDLSINDDIEKMRLSTTATLLSGRRDVIVVSSVSCIYGIGNPEDFKATSVSIKVGDLFARKYLIFCFVQALYTRTEKELTPGTFSVQSSTIDIMSAYGGDCYRITMFDDEIEAIEIIDPETRQHISNIPNVTIFPANLFVTTKDRIARAIGQIYVDMGTQVAAFENNGRMIEAQRLKQRVEYDLEMIKELGYCSGIENYSRYFDNREPGHPPFCLLNYFPSDFITFVDESHVTLPQIRGMFGGDRSRKENLVEYGFRLEAAKDNRPLRFDEYTATVGASIFVSATPGDYELDVCNNVVTEQLIRPTGLIDPPMILRPSEFQIDDLINEVNNRIANKSKVMITTITKRMAEEVSKYFDRMGIRNRYIHSDIDTIERVQILDDLRADLFDVLVGVNLLREGLDLPEVGLVAILDADKEGFLRNRRSLTQIAGRAARHALGEAILYGNKCSDSLACAIIKSNRHRMTQIRYNLTHKQIPAQAMKSSGGANQLLSSRPTEESMTMKNSYPLVEEHYQRVAEPAAVYTTEKNQSKPSKTETHKRSIVDYTTGEVTFAEEVRIVPEKLSKKDIEAMIAEERRKMDEATKTLDFKTAIIHRDKIYELEKMMANSKKVSYKL